MEQFPLWSRASGTSSSTGPDIVLNTTAPVNWGRGGGGGQCLNEFLFPLESHVLCVFCKDSAKVNHPGYFRVSTDQTRFLKVGFDTLGRVLVSQDHGNPQGFPHSQDRAGKTKPHGKPQHSIFSNSPLGETCHSPVFLGRRSTVSSNSASNVLVYGTSWELAKDTEDVSTRL